MAAILRGSLRRGALFLSRSSTPASLHLSRSSTPTSLHLSRSSPMMLHIFQNPPGADPTPSSPGADSMALKPAAASDSMALKPAAASDSMSLKPAAASEQTDQKATGVDPTDQKATAVDPTDLKPTSVDPIDQFPPWVRRLRQCRDALELIVVLYILKLCLWEPFITPWWKRRLEPRH
ncbi:hypothetical protein OROMI_003915 [Orobanche minor]